MVTGRFDCCCIASFARKKGIGICGAISVLFSVVALSGLTLPKRDLSFFVMRKEMQVDMCRASRVFPYDIGIRLFIIGELDEIVGIDDHIIEGEWLSAPFECAF